MENQNNDSKKKIEDMKKIAINYDIQIVINSFFKSNLKNYSFIYTNETKSL